MSKSVRQARDLLLDTIHTTQKAMGRISCADAAAGIEPANAWAGAEGAPP